MIRRTGFICITQAQARKPNQRLFFGPNRAPEARLPYENLMTNGLKLFDTRREANEAKAALALKQDINQIDIAFFEISWAERPEELNYFVQKNKLFALGISTCETMVDYFLVGPPVPGSPPSFDKYSLLSDNGIALFDSYEDARCCCREIAQHGDMEATIGTIIGRILMA